jgi:hypothetical protein
MPATVSAIATNNAVLHSNIAADVKLCPRWPMQWSTSTRITVPERILNNGQPHSVSEHVSGCLGIGERLESIRYQFYMRRAVGFETSSCMVL